MFGQLLAEPVEERFELAEDLLGEAVPPRLILRAVPALGKQADRPAIARLELALRREAVEDGLRFGIRQARFIEQVENIDLDVLAAFAAHPAEHPADHILLHFGFVLIHVAYSQNSFLRPVIHDVS